ncbi:hypothetical protein BDW62DRAFT_200116 [Aspergillus aurantiobrunneus]
MPRRTNPPRSARQNLAHGPYTKRRITKVFSDDDGHLRHKAQSRNGQSPARNSNSPKKLLLCLDYGTASTSLSYLTFDPRSPPADVNPTGIRPIKNWPQVSGYFDGDSSCVPSESWYRDGEYLWGFQVRQTLERLTEYHDLSSINCVVQLPKLLLDNDGEDEDDGPLFQPRQALRNVGKTPGEAIQDYLMKVFEHAHQQLALAEGFNETWEVELVLCVPSKWSTYAQLTMQEIVIRVVESTCMRGSAFSMFIIDEPEAAVTFALSHDIIRRGVTNGKCFMVCDAGGGTVDAITYRARQQEDKPFRFDEIVTPAGNYINQALIEESRQRLAHLKDFGRGPNFSKEGDMQEQLFRKFEDDTKRKYDPAQLGDGEPVRLRVYGLQADASRNFGQGTFCITKEQMNSYFKRSIEGTVSLIREQLDKATRHKVKRLLLVGGFSKSPVLRRCMRETFGTTMKVLQLDTDVDMATAVSRGGILRALNKEDGPRRMLRLNLGVCVTEPLNQRFSGHRISPSFTHHLNKQKYVGNCIDWVIRKNRVVPEIETAEILMHRVFEPGNELVAWETIYFSDRPVTQHYRQDHPKNAGHRQAGVVSASLEILRELDMLELKVNSEGQGYYEVQYSIRLQVNGRNVIASVHCPPGENVQGETQICIAAAFRPGTM